MRFAIVSDIHANLQAWNAVLLGAGLAVLGAGQTLALETINDTYAGEMLRYSPGWTLWKGPHPRDGTLHYANSQGASLELTFRGTAVYLLHKVGSDCGIAQITINGHPAATAELDTYSPEVDWNRRTLLADGLSEGEHTVRIEVTGRNDPRSINRYVQVVGFDVDDTGWHRRAGELAEMRRREREARLAAYRERCPPIVFVKRHHFRRPGAVGVLPAWDVFSPGGGIYALDPRTAEEGRREVVVDGAKGTVPRDGLRKIFRDDRGVVFDMSLSYDAQKLLFSWMNLSQPGADSFHVYETNIDGTGLRQLTHGPFHDVWPVYLPDGRIAFVSTRVESYSMCQDAPASALYTMGADGSDIRRIQFGTLADLSPHVLDNGSILFTRWEYQDKSVFSIQSLWTINPDGTRLNLFYGNTITTPNTIWQARPIPGTRKVLCTLAPHHNNPVGAIGILDRYQGVENPRALRNLTPEIPYEATTDPDWRPGDRFFPWSYRDPYPIDSDLFLVSHGCKQLQRYRLFLLDDRGEKALLHEDANFSCFNAIPLVPRRRPHLLPPREPTGENRGTFLLADVYQGLTGVPRGSVERLRVMSTVPKRVNNRGARAYYHGHDIVDPVIGAGTFYVKYNFGTVPVDPDGSAHFQAPAGRELYFQALDARGRELSRMGSLTQLMPGEQQGCIGCHERRALAPPSASAMPAAFRRPPAAIEPPPWGAGPVDFVGQVQPVLDKHCAGCHSGVNPAAGIDLSGDKTRLFSMAYENLVARNLVQFYYLTPPQEETGNFLPLTTGSRVSRVVQLLDAGHSDVALSPEEAERLYTWIEANVPYYATYEHTRPGTPGSRDAWRGAWIRELDGLFKEHCAACHGGLDLRHNRHSTWVNLSRPRYSRMLNAPLAESAGGLERCKARNGAEPARFADRDDSVYRAMLRTIEQGMRELAEKPRMDMPGAVPAPCEPGGFGRLYRGLGRYR